MPLGEIFPRYKICCQYQCINRVAMALRESREPGKHREFKNSPKIQTKYREIVNFFLKTQKIQEIFLFTGFYDPKSPKPLIFARKNNVLVAQKQKIYNYCSVKLHLFILEPLFFCIDLFDEEVVLSPSSQAAANQHT